MAVKVVNQGVLADFSYDNPGGGSTFDFTNTSQRASSYQWDFGDGATSTATSPSHTFSPDSYDVKLTASNLCNTTMVTQTITVPGTEIYIPVTFK